MVTLFYVKALNSKSKNTSSFTSNYDKYGILQKVGVYS